MSQIIREYIKKIQGKFDQGGATEHTYRPPLEELLLGLNEKITVTNEHERITGVGMPDFTIKDKKNSDVIIGRVEAKDVNVDLSYAKNRDQLDRYLKAFPNFIYTNYLSFQFYRDGKLYDGVSLGKFVGNKIQRDETSLLEDNLQKLEILLKGFLSYQGQTIKSAEKLAISMAGKAQLIAYAIKEIFSQEEGKSILKDQYKGFKEILIQDMTENEFADMYAQTIVYGLFVARLHDPTLEDFSRQEAEKLIPKSTPFLRWLFREIGNDDTFDDRIAYIIDDLVKIFLHCNVKEILENHGKSTQRNDPIMHFYETFLGEYNPKLRKARGVYYTPDAVVNFIVRGIDYILKNDFGLSMGLADTSKIDHKFTVEGKKITKSVHRVQVLDPAVGTGTFLNDIIKYIYANYFESNKGIWSQYVKQDLLPRIFGFELLMASYTMCHLKLGLTLDETGYNDTGENRI